MKLENPAQRVFKSGTNLVLPMAARMIGAAFEKNEHELIGWMIAMHIVWGTCL